MRRLVFITQQVDPGDPSLAATVPKIAALAERVDEVAVLALGGLPGAVPENVSVRLFGARTKLGRGVRFEAALARELRPRPDAVVAHMCPIYAVLAAPLVRPLRIPLLLWFTHWRLHSLVRLAEKAVHRVVSVDRRSFPLDSPKVHALGHGIDLREFSCRDAAGDGTLRVLALGRYSPAKGLDVVLRGLRMARDSGLDATLEAHGPALSREERGHRRQLDRLVEELDLAGVARLEGPVPRARVPELLVRSDVVVNNMRAGAPDKVVYEACASCLPVLASNPVFDELFAGLEPELSFDRDDPEQLAERLAALAATGVEERARLGRELRGRVEAGHSVGSWADGVLAVAEGVR
jgi:glycosyltransferase involved in cell wall biosynthesis